MLFNKLLQQFTILAILFMFSNAILKRNDYLTLRNKCIKKSYLINNIPFKKTIIYISNKVNNLYNNYLNLYYSLSFKYYSISDNDLLIIDNILAFT